MFSGKFKKIKNLKFFEWREVKEEVNFILKIWLQMI